jgi:hypothetical protein
VGEVAERLRVPRHQLLLPAQHGFTFTPAPLNRIILDKLRKFLYMNT